MLKIGSYRLESFVNNSSLSLRNLMVVFERTLMIIWLGNNRFFFFVFFFWGGGGGGGSGGIRRVKESEAKTKS